MVSKNNHQLINQRNAERVQQRWTLRKYSIGVASVLLGTTMLFGSSAVAHADTTSGVTTASTETEQFRQNDQQQNSKQVLVLSNNAQADHTSAVQATPGAANFQSETNNNPKSQAQTVNETTMESAQPTNPTSTQSVTGEQSQNQPAIQARSEDQQITYNFIDIDSNNKKIGSQIVKHNNDEINLPLVYYTLADGETLPTEYDFNSNNGKTINIRLKHATERVQRQKQITRTINYVDEKGRQLANPVTQISRMLTQYGSQDKVTGEITWGDWSFVSSDSDSHLAVFDSYKIPEQLNYHPVINGKAVKIIPRSGITVDENGNPVSTTIDVYYQSDEEPIPETKTITRDIYVQAGSKPIKVGTQSVTLHRNNSKNTITGEITLGRWDNATFPAFEAPELSGYKVSNPDAAVAISIGDTGNLYDNYDAIFNYSKQDYSNNTEILNQSKTVTRDIYTQIHGQSTRQKVSTQEVTIYRVGVKNLSTGEITWTDWLTTNMPEYSAPTIDGYTATNPDAGASMTVDGSETQLPDVVFEYQANTATNPSSNASMNLMQENDETGESNEKTITRTIIIHNLDGTTKKIVQTINFEKSSDSDSFVAVDSPEIDGYITNTKQVPEEEAKFDANDSGRPYSVTRITKPVNVVYTANEQSINIIYKDGNTTIKTTPLNGHTGETVDVDLDVPANYYVANDVPTSYKFKANGNPDIIVELEHDIEPEFDTKTIKRIINVTNPDGNSNTVTQEATLNGQVMKDLVTGEIISWQDWSTGTWYAYEVPTIKGYTPTQATVARQTVTKDTRDTIVNISYVANEQHANIIYKDGNQTIKTTPITGKTDQTININLDVPEYYHVTNEVPSNYTFQAENNKDVIVDLGHDTQNVSDTKSVVRTIKITDPDNQVKTIKQTATINRRGTKDLVTNNTTWQGWTTGTWDAYDVPTIAGYTPTQASVEQQTVTSETTDAIVDITYTVNEQQIHVVYKDGEQTIKSTPLNGHTDETVNVVLDVPTNYRVTNKVPTTYTFKASDNNDIIVELAHNTEPASNTKTIIRTINVTSPDGTTKTTKQTVTLHRDGTKDLITGNTEWQDWSTGTWDAYDVPTIAGYTPTQASVEQQTVTSETTDTTVDISYTANEQQIHVIYKDGDQTIKSAPLSGHTAETVNVDLDVPANYHVTNNVPANYTFKASDNNDIIVELAHNSEPALESKTITRTINVTSPDGTTNTTKQTVTLNHKGTKDLVTNDIDWQEWSTGTWGNYDVPTIAGYTPTRATVESQTVDSDTKDTVVNISYTANDQITHVIYKDGDQVIKTDTLTGKTGQTIHVTPHVPDGYHLVSQSARDYTFKATDNQDIIIQVAKNHTDTPTDNHNDNEHPQTPINDNQQQPTKTKNTNNKVPTNVSAIKNNAQKATQQKLPQTGNEENEHAKLEVLLSSLGLSMIGGFFLKKKRNEKN